MSLPIRTPTRLAVVAMVVVVAVTGAGCTTSADQPSKPSSPEPSPDPSPASLGRTGGTPTRPAAVTAATDLLTWTSVDGDAMDTAVTNGR